MTPAEEIVLLRADIERQKIVITGLSESLARGCALISSLMDEVLHLHRHANERLPLGLINAKDEFDSEVRKLLEVYRGN